jgi:hypothetical protein
MQQALLDVALPRVHSLTCIASRPPIAQKVVYATYSRRWYLRIAIITSTYSGIRFEMNTYAPQLAAMYRYANAASAAAETVPRRTDRTNR